MSDVDTLRHRTDKELLDAQRAEYALPCDEISDEDDRAEALAEQWEIASYQGWAMQINGEG
jgi:hypothetical protein